MIIETLQVTLNASWNGNSILTNTSRFTVHQSSSNSQTTHNKKRYYLKGLVCTLQTCSSPIWSKSYPRYTATVCNVTFPFLFREREKQFEADIADGYKNNKNRIDDDDVQHLKEYTYALVICVRPFAVVQGSSQLASFQIISRGRSWKPVIHTADYIAE